MEQIKLDGLWQLIMLPNSDINCEILSSSQLVGKEVLQATVPGNFELDLLAAGKIKDPYIGANIWDLYRYENYHLFYYRKFSVNTENIQYELCMDGIDTFADVYVNGVKILHADNMFIGYSAPLDNLRKDNEIFVHIYPTMLEARKNEYSMISWQNTIYGQAGLYVRKAPYMFGWDIMPRAVSGGLFRSCYLRRKKSDRIKDVSYFVTELKPEKKEAKLWFTFNTDLSDDRLYGQYSIEIEGKCGDGYFSCEQELWHTSGKIHMVVVENCHFWYPKNYGDPELYATVAILKKNGKEVDRFNFNLGIRKVELLRSSVMDGENNRTGKFGFRINGKDIFVLGTNWTPLDIYPSKFKERMPAMLEELKAIGCNAVRCWGGNIYESEEFFDFCDKNGIIVWQDFALACGVYPSDDEFCSAMRKEAKYIVRKLRNHPSICLWAGDNECDMFSSWMERNPNNIRVTREVFPQVIDEEDFTTPYLPSSPYLDEIAYTTRKQKSENHNWAREWIKSSAYKDDPACFQSEIGCQASPSPDSMKRYLSTDDLFPWFDDGSIEKYGVKIGNKGQCAHVPQMEQKPCHDSFILPKTDEYFMVLFGREPQNLDEYAKMSQIYQAEAFKYFIERMRVDKPHKTGIMWWNLFDGFTVHSNAVIDYYGARKLAYYYIQRSQQPLLLMFDEPVNGKIALHVINDFQSDKVVSYKVSDAFSRKEIVCGKCKVAANGNVIVENLDNPNDKAMFLIEYEIDGVIMYNHFTCNMPNINFEWYIDCLTKIGFYQFQGFGD